MEKTQLDIFWVLLAAILVLAMQAGFRCQPWRANARAGSPQKA